MGAPSFVERIVSCFERDPIEVGAGVVARRGTVGGEMTSGREDVALK